MINSTAEYKAAVVADTRRIRLLAIIDIVSPDLVYGEITSTPLASYSKKDQLTDKKFDIESVATLETNRWLLDGSFNLLPFSGQIGIAFDSLSDGQGETSQFVEMSFENVPILQACSVHFSKDELDGVPADFKVEVKQGGTTYYEKEFSGNASASVYLDGFTVYNPDAIRVTLTKTNIQHRRVRIAEIVLGIYEEWDGSMFSDFSVKHQADVSCVSLPYGTCSISIDNQSRRFEPRSKNGIFQSIEERQGIETYLGVDLPDGTTEYKKLGLFYQYSGGWKTGDNGLTMNWDLVDIVGLLSDREFIPPETLPTTLGGWAQALVEQLGENFANRYEVDPNYTTKTVTVREKSDAIGISCGDLMTYLGMATGTWPRADAETGKLCFEPLWDAGNKITLENMEEYPTIKANDDIAAIVFKLNDGNNTNYVVSGTSTASSKTVSIENPFIKDTATALLAARQILSAYGGNQYEIKGRGDPASEIGDVDTLWLDESSAASARRIEQDLSLSDGVLKGCKSVLLQADGWTQYEGRAVITQSGQWTAPEGATNLRVILVGKGGNGADGKDGTWDESGADGADGVGGKVWSDTISINPQQMFDVYIDEHTVFGQYTSENGSVYEYGYTDILSGNTYARTGVKSPISGTGDGGKGGAGGAKGERRTETGEDGSSHTVIDSYPKPGEPGVKGVLGCVVVYWDKGDAANG